MNGIIINDIKYKFVTYSNKCKDCDLYRKESCYVLCKIMKTMAYGKDSDIEGAFQENKSIKIMKEDILTRLQWISDNLEQTGKDLREMEKVWDEELKDRLAKGITGDAAVQHYNEWMDKAGMSHLKTKEK